VTTYADPRPGGRDGEVERAQQLAGELAALGVHGLVLSWVDTSGVNRIKAVPVRRLTSAVESGAGMSPVFDMFLSNDWIVGSDLQGSPDGDLRLVPDLDSVVALEGQPGWAWSSVDRLTQAGEPHPGCSRTLLRRLVTKAAEGGLEFKASQEIEFALGRDDVPWPDFAPACHGPAYGMTRLVEQTDFLRDALVALEAQGVPVDQIHPEYAAGQYEVSVGALDPVGAADRSVLVRQTLRAVAQQHGLRISFSPLVAAGGVGNGGHVHLSAWRDGVSLHAGGEGRYGLTADGESFAAGILEHLPALAAVATPSPVSYLRMQPSHWAGVYAVWGYETRESAVRLVTGTVGTESHAANLEVKAADLSANPYLLLAGLIGAGLAGVATGSTLPEEITGDPSRYDEAEAERLGIRRLPTSLEDALTVFESSALVSEIYGPLIRDAVLAVRRGELANVEALDPEAVVTAYRWVY
jgi:glutamine synthetase